MTVHSTTHDTFKYHWIADPGHSWLCVPLNEVQASGFKPSEFSFKSGPYALLEEDCDAPGFLRHTERLTQINTYPTKHIEEFNRSLPRFS